MAHHCRGAGRNGRDDGGRERPCLPGGDADAGQQPGHLSPDAGGVKNRIYGKFDIIYFDPPYNSKIYISVISLIIERNLLNENGYLIVELGYEYYKKFVENFNNIKCDIKIYGETVLIIFEKRNL